MPRRAMTAAMLPHEVPPGLPAPASATLSADEHAIVKSVLYASLFDYPLTLAELRQTLIARPLTPGQIVALHEGSPRLQQLVAFDGSVFFPRNRPELPAIRAERASRTRAFLARHRTFLRLVCAMPFVRLVALSGSVAHLNMTADGDLDLFVVTRGSHAWSVSVALVLLARLAGRRRLMCANYVMSDARLAVDSPDLFTASQLLHLRPLTGHDVHRALLAANPFVYDYYPNAHVPRRTRSRRHAAGAVLKRLCEWLLGGPAWMAEWCCRTAYGRYLRRRVAACVSPDQVCLSGDRLKLHTNSHRRVVLERFDRLVDAVCGTREGVAGDLRIDQ